MKLSLIANSLTGSEINKIASEIKQKIAKGQKVFNFTNIAESVTRLLIHFIIKYNIYY